MEIARIEDHSYLVAMVENVTQPHLTVELRIQTADSLQDLESKTKLAYYMADQCKMLIPFFYELRNEMPRGRVKQMMNQRAKELTDEAAVKAYHHLLLADEFEFASDLPLRTITLEGRRMVVAFACAHDPEHIYFQREMTLPVDKPDFQAQVEAFEVARLAEIELNKSKAGGADNDAEVEVEDEAFDEIHYDMAM